MTSQIKAKNPNNVVTRSNYDSPIQHFDRNIAYIGQSVRTGALLFAFRSRHLAYRRAEQMIQRELKPTQYLNRARDGRLAVYDKSGDGKNAKRLGYVEDFVKITEMRLGK